MRRDERGCGKTPYRDKKEAMATMHARLSSGNEPAAYLRIYECGICPGRKWHLTSQPSRVAAVAGGEG